MARIGISLRSLTSQISHKKKKITKQSIYTNICDIKNLHPCPGGVTIKCAEVKSKNEKNNVKAWASSRWASDIHIILYIIFTVVFSSDDPADPRSGSADLRAPIPDCRAVVVGRPTVLLLPYTYPPLNQLAIKHISLYNNIIMYTRSCTNTAYSVIDNLNE